MYSGLGQAICLFLGLQQPHTTEEHTCGYKVYEWDGSSKYSQLTRFQLLMYAAFKYSDNGSSISQSGSEQEEELGWSQREVANWEEEEHCSLANFKETFVISAHQEQVDLLTLKLA